MVSLEVLAILAALDSLRGTTNLLFSTVGLYMLLRLDVLPYCRALSAAAACIAGLSAAVTMAAGVATAFRHYRRIQTDNNSDWRITDSKATDAREPRRIISSKQQH